MLDVGMKCKQDRDEFQHTYHYLTLIVLLFNSVCVQYVGVMIVSAKTHSFYRIEAIQLYIFTIFVDFKLFDTG